jgi:hypothetical protein
MSKVVPALRLRHTKANLPRLSHPIPPAALFLLNTVPAETALLVILARTHDMLQPTVSSTFCICSLSLRSFLPAYTTGANENHTPQGQQQQRHGNAYNSGSQRQSHITTPISYTSNHVRPNNSEWAVPPGLVTTRGAIRNSEELLKKAEFDSYCTRPDSNEPFAATVHYLYSIARRDL